MPLALESHPHGAEAALPSDQDMSRRCWGLVDLRRESEQRRACRGDPSVHQTCPYTHTLAGCPGVGPAVGEGGSLFNLTILGAKFQLSSGAFFRQKLL